MKSDNLILTMAVGFLSGWYGFKFILTFLMAFLWKEDKGLL